MGKRIVAATWKPKPRNNERISWNITDFQIIKLPSFCGVFEELPKIKYLRQVWTESCEFTAVVKRGIGQYVPVSLWAHIHKLAVMKNGSSHSIFNLVYNSNIRINNTRFLFEISYSVVCWLLNFWTIFF